MRFNCVPTMRAAYEQIAASHRRRQIDILRDDGGFVGDEEGLCLIYLCIDLESLPGKRPTFQYGGEFVLRKAAEICRGFIGLIKNFLALRLEDLDPGSLTPEQQAEIRELSMRAIAECAEGKRIPSYF